LSLEKMLPICQINSPQGRVAHSSSGRQSTFHLRALRNACRRRDAYLQSRSFALSESTAETQPKLPTGFAEIVSDYFPSISRGEILPLNDRKAVGVTAPFRGGCVVGFQCEQRRLRATTAVPLK